MKISEILLKYDTDKVTGHCYGDSYDEIFGQFDKNSPLNILEIGTQKGGSLCAWQDYFPKAKITGIDIVDVRNPEYVRKDINYIFDDVNNVKLDKEYDLIIDDGSHFYQDVEYVVKNFLPHLKQGGVMVIEDVQHSESWVWNLRKFTGGCNLSVRDLREVHGNYDDFLIVIQK